MALGNSVQNERFERISWKVFWSKKEKKKKNSSIPYFLNKSTWQIYKLANNNELKKRIR